MPSDSWELNETEFDTRIRPNYREKFYFTEFILRFSMPQIPLSTIYVQFRVLEWSFISAIASLGSFKTIGFRDPTDEERITFGFPNQNIQAFYTLSEERKEFTIWLRIPRLSLSTITVFTRNEIRFSLKEDQIRLLLESVKKLKNQGYKEDERGVKSQFA